MVPSIPCITRSTKKEPARISRKKRLRRARKYFCATGKVRTSRIGIYVNRAPQLFLNYTTAWPLTTFYIILFITMIFVMAIYVAGAVLLLGLSWFFLERAFGPGRIPPWRELNAAYFRDALYVAVFGSAAVMGLNRLPALFARWPLLRHSLGASVPENLDVLNPAMGALASS